VSLSLIPRQSQDYFSSSRRWPSWVPRCPRAPNSAAGAPRHGREPGATPMNPRLPAVTPVTAEARCGRGRAHRAPHGRGRAQWHPPGTHRGQHPRRSGTRPLLASPLRRRRQRSAPAHSGSTAVSGRGGGATRPIWITSVTDWLDHAVTLDTGESARASSPLRPVAVCGLTLLPAALVEPPGRRCWRCVETLALRQPHRRRGRRHARPSAWRRLLGLHPPSHRR
jgi:hypothetical protein